MRRKRKKPLPRGNLRDNSKSISVRMTPGATQLTRTPDGPASCASAFVQPITPAFAAE